MEALFACNIQGNPIPAGVDTFVTGQPHGTNPGPSTHTFHIARPEGTSPTWRQTVKVDCFRLADHPGGRHGAVGCPSAVFNDRRPDELSLHGRPCQQWFGDASEPTCIVIADDESKGSRAGGQADPPAPCQTISLQLAFRGERKETLYVFSESLHHSHSLQYNSGDGTTKHAQRRTYTRCFAATLG